MKKSIVLCAAFVMSSALSMRAQQVPVDTQGARGTAPAGQVRDRSNRLTTPIGGQVVKGAPYSAEFVSESIQTLSDGNRIVHRTTGRVYRDSEGRVRREEDQASGVPTVSITDPVAGKSFALNPANRTARETRALGFFDLNQYVLQGHAQGLYTYSSFIRMAPFDYNVGLRGARPGSDVAIEEKLTDRTIEGVIASGIRRTTTIAAGTIGNERPIRIVSEEWTSPQLQVLVLTDLDDPRAGRSTYRLLRISRAEPDPALFRVPGGFAVEPLPPAGKGGGYRQ